MNPFFLMMLSSFKGNDDNNNNNLYKYSIILAIIMPYITKFIPFNEIKKYFVDTFMQDKNIVSKTVPSHEVPVIRGFSNTPTTKIVYSKVFLSIIHYLNTNNNYFDTLTEVISLNTELTNSYDEDERRVKDNQYMYIPISSKKVLINDNIYCEINDIDTKDKENDDDNKNNNKNTIKSIKKNNFVIILSISKKNGNEMDILNQFINNCLEKYDLFINKKDDLKQYIYEYKSCEKSDNNIELYFDKFLMEHNKDLEINIFFEDKTKLINYIKPFVYKPLEKYNIGEERYKRSGFTFKAGLLFYGAPGCGKTSTIKAILRYTNRHGIIINLSKVKTCQELETIFRKRTFCGKNLEGKQLCFILEDCDAFEDNIIHSRKKDEEDKKLVEQNNNSGSDLIQFVKLMESGTSTVKFTSSNNDNVNLSCFLNILDGIIELHGVMIIMTTNHPEKIDEALIRPGRFDFKYEFKKASRKIIKEMLQFKFELSQSQIDKYCEHMNIKDDVLSPAEIQSICFKNDNVIDCINDIILAAQK